MSNPREYTCKWNRWHITIMFKDGGWRWTAERNGRELVTSHPNDVSHSYLDALEAAKKDLGRR